MTAGLGLSVTAAQADDRRASFAGRGSQVSLAAYGALTSSETGGRGLFGLYPPGDTPRERPTALPPSPGCGCRASFGGDPRYAFLPGTSMAAPQVAAAAALIRALNPEVGALETVRLLKEQARRPAGAGWEPELGWGILDAGAAVDAARRVDRTYPLSRASAPALARGRSVVVRWAGRDLTRPGLIPSGIARYEVYRSADGGPARRIATTRATRRRIRVLPGRRYAFFTIAVDHAGNREPRPSRADARVSVARA
jgi:subtilisin family serine protease